MSLHTHLVPTLEGVAVGSTVTVAGAVRRIAVGEPVTLTDGAGRVATGAVAETGKQRLLVTVAALERVPPPEPELVVVQALPKGDRGELAVEVLTEIGVARIVPWAASRSVAVWRGERADKALAKWRATAREAAKQSHRAWFPTVDPLASTADVAALLADAPLALVLHEESAVPLASLAVPATGPVVLVVGPEGGIAPDELAAFGAAGAQVTRLGAEVLRTSTAGLAAAAALLARTDRWA